MATRRPKRKTSPATVAGKGEQDSKTTNIDAVQILSDPEFRAIQSAIWMRWRRLARSKDFIWVTLRLKYRITRLFERQPAVIKQFFSPSFLVYRQTFKRISTQLRGAIDDDARLLLLRYSRYAVRYNVHFVLAKTEPYFRVRFTGFTGDKFHVVVRDNTLGPKNANVQNDPTAAWGEDFEAVELPVPDSVSPLIEEGLARYALVEDQDRFSLLAQLIDVAYSPDKVTVIRYAADPPMTLCLVGESVPLSQISGPIAKVVTESQREASKSDSRGRTPDPLRLHGLLMALLRGRSTQDLAYMYATSERLLKQVTRGQKPTSKDEKPEKRDERELANRIAVMASSISQMKGELDR